MEEIAPTETDSSNNSLWMIRAAELFPKEPLKKEDDSLQIPFIERKQAILF